MNDHFEGVQLQWNYSGFNHQQQDTLQSLQHFAEINPNNFSVPGDVGLDGRSQNFNILLGSNFANGKGNATVYFSWQQTDAVTQGTRNFSSCALSSTKTDLICGGGSLTSATGFFYSPVSASGGFTIADRAGNVRPFDFVADRYNFAPINYFQRPNTQYSFNAFAHYDVDKGALGFLPAARVYTEFDFSNNHTDAQIAARGIFYQDLYTLKDRNPFAVAEFQGCVRHHAHIGRNAVHRAPQRRGRRTRQRHQPGGLPHRPRREGRPVRRRHLELQWLVAVGHQPAGQSESALFLPGENHQGAGRRHRPEYRQAGLRIVC